MEIKSVSISSRRTAADLLVIGYFQKSSIPKGWVELAPDFFSKVKIAVEKGRFEGKPGQAFYSYQEPNREAGEILLLGLGEKKNFKATCLRKAASEVARQARARKAGRIRVLVDSFAGGEVPILQAVKILSAFPRLALYEFDKYKSKKEDEKLEQELKTIELLTLQKQKEGEIQKKMAQAEAIAEGVLLARDLVNEPGNVMNAPKLSEIAENLAKKKKLFCKVMGLHEIKELKMGGLLAVNQGSVTPPAFIVLEYGNRFKSKGTLCLVGKGVTFDTGGISIKPSKDMEKMKYDMAGAATVIATMGVVADLKPNLHIVALVPAVENNVAENPQRPGDIIRMMNGKTVEVINTDAEGRLILGDALAYAEKYEPKAIIDLATLTGMCAYTFGDKAIGLMGNNLRLLERIKKAGEETGERLWELPLWEDYKDQIKGHHSDLLNTGGPYGGTITAAMFLKEFVPAKTAWAHLDIAGTAWCDSSRPECVKGATGIGVRLLAKLIMDWK